MPLYEYECKSCGSVFEKMQKFSDEPLTVHENCGGHVRRLLSAPSFQFKGTGWYITDYARGKGGDSNGTKKADSEKKTESKPAASNSSTPASSAPEKK